jgi:hypothetical protein
MQYTDQRLFVGTINQDRNVCTQSSVLKNIWPKVVLMVVFQGEQTFTIDGQDFCINAGSADKNRPLVLLLNIAEVGEVRFFGQSPVPLKKVFITAPTTWLREQVLRDSGGRQSVVGDFLAQHLAHFMFEPGEHLLNLAARMIDPPQ